MKAQILKRNWLMLGKKNWLMLGMTGLVLLLFLAKVVSIGWRLFAPSSGVSIKADALDYREGVAWAGGLFGAEPVQAVAAKAVTSTDIKILGILSAKEGEKAYALLLLDGQKTDIFSVGQEIVSGLKLTKIDANSIVVESSVGEKEILLNPQGSSAHLIGSADASSSSAGSISSNLIVIGDATRSGMLDKGATAPSGPAQGVTHPANQPVPMNRPANQPG